MIARPEIDASRTTDGQESEYNVDDGASEVQRGLIKRPSFFGDHSNSGAFSSFASAANLASSFAGAIQQIKPSAAPGYRLTAAQYAKLQQVAQSIASYGNVPLQCATDFLLILCYIDRVEDLITIADAVQIAELADEKIVRQPDLILAIRGLEAVAYCASAVDSLVNLFRKYITLANNSPQDSSNDISGILSTLSGLLGGLGGLGGATARLDVGNPADALGNFMSELITGKRIPMTVIAKNPNLQSPSYAGKVFFGEGPTALSNVDIEQLFSKKIACFPKPANGGGLTSFNIQNIGSISKLSTPISLAAKLLQGSQPAEGTKKMRQLNTAMEKVRLLTGCTDNEIITANSADVAIPLMSALSAVSSGTDKPIFSNDTFQQGWIMANSVANQIQTTNPGLIQVMGTML